MILTNVSLTAASTIASKSYVSVKDGYNYNVTPFPSDVIIFITHTQGHVIFVIVIDTTAEITVFIFLQCLVQNYNLKIMLSVNTFDDN